MSKKNYVYVFMALAVITTLAVAGPTFAQTATNTNIPPAWGAHERGGRPMMEHGVFGIVSTTSGNTITITSRTRQVQGSTNTATTTYTIDATNAKITKNGTISTISSIAVGDLVMVQGTITGTNVTAIAINDGIRKPENGVKATRQPIITGNGQPVIAGVATVINGSTITITNKSNVIYTIDASNAKIVQGQNTITVSGISAGDSIVVQGTINGNTVTASTVIDQKPLPTNKPEGVKNTHKGGFFSSIGSFFSHLFGF